jgi:hypothetical protein
MKKGLLALLLSTIITAAAFSQNIPFVEGLRMDTPQDYHNADSTVLLVSHYLLSIPINTENYNRLKISLFLTRWMDGSPEFTVVPNTKVTRYIENDVDLMAVYYASLCSFVLEYPSVKDKAAITLNTAKTLADYIGNGNNHVILTRQLRKMVAANQEGKLKSFLNL